jgi:Fe-S cluster assembly protein SufD
MNEQYMVDTSLAAGMLELPVPSSPLSNKRETAKAHFNTLGFPTTKHEEWKYSNVAKLVKQTFSVASQVTTEATEYLQNSAFPNLSDTTLFFVNGHFVPALSNLANLPSGLKITTFAEAEQNGILNEAYAALTKDESEAFTALNTAYAQDGIVIQVAANTQIESPVVVRHLVDATQENTFAQTRNLVSLGKGASLQFVEHFDTLGSQTAFANVVTEIKLENQAQMYYYKIQEGGDNSHHVGTTEVYQADNSYCYSATVTLSGLFTRNNLHLSVDGSNIDGNMYGLYVPSGKEHVDNHTLVDHRKPHSQSNELYKGILKDQSTGVFNGKIYVQEDAQKTNAYQNCKNVLLSDSATMNTKPQLEIWADDVKCSHGTTTGQLDNEVIFYMQARGIPKDEAIKLQLLAFAGDVITQIKLEKLQSYIEEKIADKLV